MKKLQFLKNPFWQKYGTVILVFALALVVLTVGLILKRNWSQKLYQQELIYQTEKGEAEAQIAQQQQQPVVNPEENAVRIQTTGCDMERKFRDDKLMADVLSYGVTWSNEAEYRSQRQKLQAKYPWLSEDSVYLTKFFPPADSVILKDSSGADVYNPLNDGRNVKFAGLYTHVIKVEDGVYYYIADMRTQSDGIVGGSAVGKILVTYAVNEQGEASDIRFFVVSS